MLPGNDVLCNQYSYSTPKAKYLPGRESVFADDVLAILHISIKYIGRWLKAEGVTRHFNGGLQSFVFQPYF